ncbi:MAG: DUF4332 domain-containing protein [Gemmatimonadetes bacterium]|nr:DUF4332 domain-containing protein [Gemmatimonadota bacterium]
MWLVVPTIALLIAWVLLLLDVEPVPTWFYVFAWYPTLFLLDAIGCRFNRRRALLADGRLAISLFGWSAPIWLCFEAVNLRLANWYYVYLPRGPVERWAGILLSFATVVPAVVLAERFWGAMGVGRRWPTRPLSPGVRDLGRLTWAGGIALAAVLLFPRWLYPLTWGAALLIADPIVYRRRPDLSLIADLERGEWGRVGRLVLSGLLIGAIWEGYNFVARGKWIYTVPLLEHVKWFEMPPLGFVGFPFFALEAWAMYHALAVSALAVPVVGEHGRAQTSADELARARLRSPALAIALAITFSLVTLAAMERWTISSTVPVIELPTAPRLTSPWQVARLTPAVAAVRLGVSTEAAAAIVESARLMTLRGIGSAHTRELARAGVRSVCELASSSPPDLWRRIHDVHSALGRRPTAAEVRVWVLAAERTCKR